MERKLFTSLFGDDAQALNNALSHQGFRRSQNVLYRPSCTDCNACLSARINLRKFKLSKSQKRVIKKNAALRRKTNSAWATEDQYELFQTYLRTRHADGGMADMDVFEFAAMIEETPIRSRVIEYYDPENALSAVCLTDVLEDGLSMVYSFYDPSLTARSMGTFMILDHLMLAQDAGLDYVYLGYWVLGSPKMDYKARFSGVEVFSGGQWNDLTNPEAYSNKLHPLNSEPIAEQVANLSLPNSSRVYR